MKVVESVRSFNINQRVRVKIPIEGRWYWVQRRSNGEWFPAIRDSYNSCGGWTNNDTWADFDHDIIAWRLIPLPAQSPPVTPP